MLNYDLAESRGLTDLDVLTLEALHEAMGALCDKYNKQFYVHGDLPRHERKQLRKRVRALEYMMQAVWGFTQDKTEHYHWKRFRHLEKSQKITVTAKNENGSVTSKAIKWSIQKNDLGVRVDEDGFLTKKI